MKRQRLTDMPAPGPPPASMGYDEAFAYAPTTRVAEAGTSSVRTAFDLSAELGEGLSLPIAAPPPQQHGQDAPMAPLTGGAPTHTFMPSAPQMPEFGTVPPGTAVDPMWQVPQPHATMPAIQDQPTQDPRRGDPWQGQGSKDPLVRPPTLGPRGCPENLGTPRLLRASPRIWGVHGPSPEGSLERSGPPARGASRSVRRRVCPTRRRERLGGPPAAAGGRGRPAPRPRMAGRRQRVSGIGDAAPSLLPETPGP